MHLFINTETKKGENKEQAIHYQNLKTTSFPFNFKINRDNKLQTIELNENGLPQTTEFKKPFNGETCHLI